jgi:glycosyltransferase involved in cell wall biosynthesis
VPNTPLISVLTPAFRCGKYLEQNLQSVQDQFYPSIEHIVVDGGSTDGTVEILKKYPSVKWVSEPDKGEADALNKAVAMSRGEYLMWLNADDYFWTEEAVEASMEAVGRLSGEKFPITHGNLVLIDDQDRPAGLRVANGPVHLPLLYRWFRHIHLNIVTMMFPRKLLEAIGPFRTDLSYSIDLDFWIRAAKAGATFHHLDRPITAVRITRSSGKSAHDDRDKQAEWQANVDSHLASDPRPEKINFYRDYFRWRLERGEKPAAIAAENPAREKAIGLGLAAIDHGLIDGFEALFRRLLATTPGINPEFAWLYAEAMRGGKRKKRKMAISLYEAADETEQTEEGLHPFRAGAKAKRDDLTVDVILPPGRHSWNVGRGWANTLQQEGMLGRVLHVTEDSGELMEEYLKSPAPDAVLLCGFDHHMPFLHLDRKWTRLWKAFAAKKVCLCQETVVGTKYPDNEKKTRSATECVDLLVYPCESDRSFFDSLGKPTLFQPFGVDELVFCSTKPWEKRNPTPLFFGKTEVKGNSTIYQERRRWLEELAKVTQFDIIPYRRRLTARSITRFLNGRQYAIQPPSEFRGTTTRQLESAACGTLPWPKGNPAEAGHEQGAPLSRQLRSILKSLFHEG